jgi:hypothetical protein
MDGWMDACMYVCTYLCMDACTYGWMDGCMYVCGCMHVWINILTSNEIACLPKNIGLVLLNYLETRLRRTGCESPQCVLTADGVEKSYACSFLMGTYLLGSKLMPLLNKSNDPRLLIVATGGLYTVKLQPFADALVGKEYHSLTTYARAKRAQVRNIDKELYGCAKRLLLFCRRLSLQFEWRIAFVS